MKVGLINKQKNQEALDKRVKRKALQQVRPPKRQTQSIKQKDLRRNLTKQCVDKMGGKCQICGLEDDPCVYDFHHLDPGEKSFTISQLIGKYSGKIEQLARLEDELKKCILLCSHCHRKLHLKMIFLPEPI